LAFRQSKLEDYLIKKGNESRMLSKSAAIFAIILAASQALFGKSMSADEYIALRRSLAKDLIIYSSAKTNPSYYIGKILELAGMVNGYASGGSTASFVLNFSGESVVISASELPECVSNGNTVRVLVKIGQASIASLSDLQLIAAAYDYDVTKRENELASKTQKTETNPVVQKKQPQQATNSRLKRGVALSSRAMRVFEPYRNAIKRFNPRLTDQQADTITASILAYSEHYGIDPRLIVALILAESNFRLEATSPKGAMGLAQLMPGTARGLGVTNPYDPVQNIEGCIKLMRNHLEKQGDLSLALACYNAGAGAVKKYGGIPPYRETQNYVRKVTEIYRMLCGK
ncbi:MAG: lytic transglycosylase domain-containing protein, partial [Armatimonadota bacterium]|nr:lytic transglycosylase domain-containing protein [Armatimonadota bacterium]